MATNNCINLKNSGIVSYDGAGTFSGLANPLPIASGGSEVSSFVAYSPICAGTTAGNPLQSVASVGSAGQVLTSNGPSALPSFQNAPSGGNDYFIFTSCTPGNPLDSATYYIAMSQALQLGTSALRASAALPIPVAGTITACYGVITATSPGSSQNIGIYLRLNDTTDYTVTTTAQASATENTFSNTGMSVSVSAGDFIAVKWVSPVWVPNPTSVSLSISFLVT